jgi:hypothetical protein
MSISITALPYLLIAYVVPIIVESSIKVEKGLSTNNTQKIHLEQNTLDEILNKEFETPFTDKEVLIKTLSEHGATNIYENKNNISCDCEVFHLNFYKMDDLPYKLIISTNPNSNVDELLNDINNEYAINVQELSYNKIKERLEAQNLNIEEEEIYDDNTIVLTVNLEE